MSTCVEKWVECDILLVDVSHVILNLRIEQPAVVGALLLLWSNYARNGPSVYTDEELARVAGFGNDGRWPNDAVRSKVLRHFRKDAHGCLVPLVAEDWVAKRQAVRERAAQASRVRWAHQASSSARKQPQHSKERGK